jgi:thioredoxin 1
MKTSLALALSLLAVQVRAALLPVLDKDRLLDYPGIQTGLEVEPANKGGSKKPSAPASAIKKVDETTYKKEVEESKQLVVVYVYAEWCGACKQVGPILEQMAAQMSDKAKWVKVDSDASPKLSARRKYVPQIFVYDPTSKTYLEHELVYLVDENNKVVGVSLQAKDGAKPEK